MADKKQIRREAFMKGFTAARKNAFTSSKLGPVTKRTAEELFERWHELNFEDATGSVDEREAEGTEHRLEYLNANESYCHTCDKTIPNAHVYHHGE